MTKLKPCPFCGGEAVLEGVDYFWGSCTSCGADTMGSHDEEEAVKNWNRRIADEGL